MINIFDWPSVMADRRRVDSITRPLAQARLFISTVGPIFITTSNLREAVRRLCVTGWLSKEIISFVKSLADEGIIWIDE